MMYINQICLDPIQQGLSLFIIIIQCIIKCQVNSLLDLFYVLKKKGHSDDRKSRYKGIIIIKSCSTINL